MYEAFYGFEEKPFSIRPDPAFLFLSQKHQRALSLLAYGLTSPAGFTVITGAVGSGKTTLIRKLLQQTDDSVTVGVVSNTHCESYEELLRWILLAFNLDYRGKDKVELYQTFADFVREEHRQNRRAVLIIDEAQNLGLEALEQLRMLSNINTDKDDLLHLILLGQPDLWRRLRRPDLIQFAQRITADYHIGSLDAEETKRYIQHRITVAGGDPDLFAEDTYELIWERTRGVPRLINILCDTALVYGFAEQKSHVDNALIQDVVADKRFGLVPIRPDEGQEDRNAVPPRSSFPSADQYLRKSQ